MRKLLVFIFMLMLFSNTASAKSLKFVQVTDNHLSINSSDYGGREILKSTQILENTVNSINQLKDIDFVIFSGDNIDVANEENLRKFCEITQNLNKPYYIGIGNHDVFKTNGLSKEKYFNIVKEYNKNQNNKKPYYYFCPDNNFIVIVMDGVHEIIPSKHGTYTEENLDWLDKVLKKYKNKTAVIVQHFPIVEPSENKSHRTLDPEGYFNLLDHHNNVATIVSGHYHTANVIQKNGIYHISSPALAEKPHQYRIIEINNDNRSAIRIDTELIPVEVPEDNN
ncbi:MAG: metallophosphoesterase [bacterium]